LRTTAVSATFAAGSLLSSLSLGLPLLLLGRKRGQSDAFLLDIDRDHPSLDQVADLDSLMRVFDITGRQTADMDQAATIRAEFDKRAELRHADDDRIDAHAGLEIR